MGRHESITVQRMSCKNCSSNNISYHKAIYKNETYHIYLTCEDCYARYNIPRDGLAYEETRGKRWMKGEEIKKQSDVYAKKRKALRKEQNALNLFN